MKAVDFIRKFGWEVAKQDLKNHELNGTRSILYIYGELKVLVDARELVQKHGGIDHAKTYSCMVLEQAITLVEEVGECDEND